MSEVATEESIAVEIKILNITRCRNSEKVTGLLLHKHPTIKQRNKVEKIVLTFLESRVVADNLFCANSVIRCRSKNYTS